MIGNFVSCPTGVIDASQGNAFKVVLTSTNGSLKFQNFKKGDTFTLIVQEDASGSNFSFSLPASVRSSGASIYPNRDTTAGAQQVFQFTYDGTNFHENGGDAVTRLPKRLAVAALAATLIVGSGIGAGIQLNVSNSAGSHYGASSIPAFFTGSTGTGANKRGVYTINASGSYIGGSGAALVVGSTDLTEDAGTIKLKNGTVSASMVSVTTLKATTTRGTSTLSGATVTANGLAAHAGQTLCVKSGGVIGYCTSSGHTAGDCTCN